MYVCEDIRCVYLAQPRTASRSVVHFLQANTVLARDSIKAHHHAMDPVLVDRYKREGWKIITAVRNHFDIIVSFYHHAPHWFSRPKQEATFANYVTDFAMRTDINKYAIDHRLFYKYQPVATHILRYETLWRDLGEATGLNTEPGRRPLVGVSKDRKPYRDYYDADSRRFVEQWYKAELEEYGYAF